MFKQGMY